MNSSSIISAVSLHLCFWTVQEIWFYMYVNTDIFEKSAENIEKPQGNPELEWGGAHSSGGAQQSTCVIWVASLG